MGLPSLYSLKKCYCALRDKVTSLMMDVLGLASVVGDNTACLNSATRLIYRYKPPAEPGFRARWWLDTAGPHNDPATWTGPAEPTSGVPLPTAAAPDFDVVNNSANVNDSNSGADAARYGFIDGWFFLPTACLVRDNNANTGELGMVLLGTCCGGSLSEAPGGNHTTNTGGTDRTLMDPTPLGAGWHYLANPSSDASAFHGLQLECSTDNGDTWAAVAQKQPTKPEIESGPIGICEPIPEGWSLDKPRECCQPTFAADSGLDEAAVLELLPDAATAAPIPDNEADAAIRTAQVGTSTDYARADHNHAIVRQANPGDPVLTFAGTGEMTQSLILDRESTEEWYAYKFRNLVTQDAGTGWGYVVVPNIAGFQRPEITGIGTYRLGSTAVQDDDGTFGASPRGPYMGKEAHEWSSTQRVYMGFFRRDNDHRTYVEFWVRYVRT